MRSGPAHAFTLIELAIVVMVIGLLAVSALPALATLDDTRRLSAIREIERRLVGARAAATATGQPMGVRIDTTGQTIRGVTIPPGGLTPVPVTAPSGEAEPEFSIPAEFPGVTITGLMSGDGFGVDTTFWFSFEGAPQLRDADGTLRGGYTQDAWIQVTGGYRVNIRRESGLIER